MVEKALREIEKEDQDRANNDENDIIDDIMICIEDIYLEKDELNDEEDIMDSIFDEEYIEDNIVIELKFVNANDWYISDNNCLIEIQNIDGILNCNCRIDTEYNDGTSSNYSKEKPMENGKVEFSWGI
mgnify:CR=1 FL=1